MNKNSDSKERNLPWALTIEEFRNSGDFKNWSNLAIQQAIDTLADLTILSFNLKKSSQSLKK